MLAVKLWCITSFDESQNSLFACSWSGFTLYFPLRGEKCVCCIQLTAFAGSVNLTCLWYPCKKWRRHIKGKEVIVSSLLLQHLGTAQYGYYRNYATDPCIDITSYSLPCCVTSKYHVLYLLACIWIYLCLFAFQPENPDGCWRCACVRTGAMGVESSNSRAASQSPGSLGITTQAATKGCLEAPCRSAGNRPTAAPCTHTMDAQSALINDNRIVRGHANVSPRASPPLLQKNKYIKKNLLFLSRCNKGIHILCLGKSMDPDVPKIPW